MIKKESSRRDFLKHASIGTLGMLTLGQHACSFGKTKKINKRMNLLFIWTDQQRYDTMLAYGNKKIKTPNFNKLTSQSFVFKNTYVTQSVSTPSRSTIMTGLYPHSNGCTANNIPLRKETPCMPELLNDPEYETAYMGKWHLGDELYAQHGFNNWVSISDGYNDYFSEGKDRMKKSTYHHWLIDKGYEPDIKNDPYGERFSRGAAAKMPLEHTKPMFLKEKACEFLNKNKDNPFILYVNYLEPHNPFFGPLDELHEDENVTVPETFYTDTIEKNELYRDQILAEKKSGRYVKNEKSIRDLVSKYWGLVSQVDKSMGAILDKVDELGLTDNTIVVFTSDHGEMLGAHKLTGKSVMFEEAVKVPFILRVPQLGMKERIVEQNVSQIDIVPTILDLMGTKPDESLQGKSLVPYMKSMEFPEEDIFIQWNPSLNHYDVNEEMAHIGDPDTLEKSLNGSARTVVTPDGWKLVLTDHDRSLLFDLNNDPLETTNVYYKPENDEVKKKLTEKILTWQKQNGDTLQLNLTN